MSPLPKWVEGLKGAPVSLLPSDSDKLIQALEIAWVFIEEMQGGSYHVVADDVASRIEELGEK